MAEGFLKCEACGFRTPPFNHGGDNTHVFYCRNCSDIVNPEVVPFLFVPPKCCKCGVQLRREDRIYTALLSGDDRIKCPKCHATSLALQYLCDILFSNEVGKVPEVGQTIHGYLCHTESDDKLPFFFMSPWLPIRLSMNVELARGSMADFDDGYYEFTVQRVTDDQLVLNCVGELPKSIWGGYYRPASEPEPKRSAGVPGRIVCCPHCGKPLRTPRAQQCFECGADWHGA